MGNTESRNTQLSTVEQEQLKYDIDGDIQYLNIDINRLLYDNNYVIELYKYGLESNYISNDNNELYILNKLYKLHSKYYNISNIKNISYNNNNYFIHKNNKILQRLIHEYNRYHNTEYDIFNIRLYILYKIYKSYYNMLQRQELNNGKRSHTSNDDKIQFIKALLNNNEKQWIEKQLKKDNKNDKDHKDNNNTTSQSTTPTTTTTTSTDIDSLYTIDDTLLQRILDASNTLPDIEGATGILGILSSTERDAYKYIISNRNNNRNLAQHMSSAVLDRLGMHTIIHQNNVDDRHVDAQQHDEHDDDEQDDDDDNDNDDDYDDRHNIDNVSNIRIEGDDMDSFVNALRSAGVTATVIGPRSQRDNIRNVDNDNTDNPIFVS